MLAYPNSLTQLNVLSLSLATWRTAPLVGFNVTIMTLVRLSYDGVPSNVGVPEMITSSSISFTCVVQLTSLMRLALHSDAANTSGWKVTLFRNPQLCDVPPISGRGPSIEMWSAQVNPQLKDSCSEPYNESTTGQYTAVNNGGPGPCDCPS